MRPSELMLMLRLSRRSTTWTKLRDLHHGAPWSISPLAARCGVASNMATSPRDVCGILVQSPPAVRGRWNPKAATDQPSAPIRRSRGFSLLSLPMASAGSDRSTSVDGAIWHLAWSARPFAGRPTFLPLPALPALADTQGGRPACRTGGEDGRGRGPVSARGGGPGKDRECRPAIG